LDRYKEGDNKDLGFWFIATGSWLKEKNQKQQTRDRKPNLYSNRAKKGVMQRFRCTASLAAVRVFITQQRKKRPVKSRMITAQLCSAPAFLFFAVQAFRLTTGTMACYGYIA